MDGMVNVMWSRRNQSRISYPTCREWCNIAQWKLALPLNQTKYEVILKGKPARAALRGCAEEGVRATPTWHGTDLGGDQVAGGRRRRPKLLQKARNAAVRGARIRHMVTIVKGLKLPGSARRGNIRKNCIFVRTNTAPAHQYGRTIEGSDPR